MKDFTLHPEASELKQLGFDELCIAWYAESKELQIAPDVYKKWTSKPCNNSNIIIVFNSDCITAPTYSQAFRWFREKYNINISINTVYSKYNENTSKKYGGVTDNESVFTNVGFHDTYEEAELACLKKLIELVKDSQKSQG